MVIVKSIPFKKTLSSRFLYGKDFSAMTQEYLEEVIPNFITLQVVPLFHLDQRNIQLYVKITPHAGVARACFSPFIISKRKKGLLVALSSSKGNRTSYLRIATMDVLTLN